jgi:hypothetical protein
MLNSLKKINISAYEMLNSEGVDCDVECQALLRRGTCAWGWVGGGGFLAATSAPTEIKKSKPEFINP